MGCGWGNCHINSARAFGRRVVDVQVGHPFTKALTDCINPLLSVGWRGRVAAGGGRVVGGLKGSVTTALALTGVGGHRRLRCVSHGNGRGPSHGNVGCSDLRRSAFTFRRSGGRGEKLRSGRGLGEMCISMYTATVPFGTTWAVP